MTTRGGTIGRGVAGTAPAGSWSLDPTGPSIVSVTPANGATGVSTSATVTIVWTAPDGIDPWSIQVSLAGLPAVAGGRFYSGSYSGSIVVDQQTATITITSHPLFSGSTSVDTTVFDLENVSATNSSSFLSATAYLVGVSDTVTVSDALVAEYNAVISASDTVTCTDALLTGHAYVNPVSDTITVSDSLTTIHQVLTTPVSNTVTVTDFTTSRYHAILTISDTISVTDTLLVTHRIPFADSMGLHDTCTVVFAHPQAASDTEPVSDSLLLRAHYRVSANETVNLTESVTIGKSFTLTVTDTVPLSESCAARYGVHILDASTFSLTDALTTQQSHSPIDLTELVVLNEVVSAMMARVLNRSETLILQDFISTEEGGFVVVSDGKTLTVTFLDGVRLDGTGDTEHFRISALDGGVPTMALTSVPIQTTLGTGTTGHILGSGVSSTMFSLGTATVLNPGEYLQITGRWQSLTARVVSTPSVGVAILDTPLLLDDPNNGSLSWTHLSAVTGVVLSIHEPTNAKMYLLTISELIKVDGTPMNGSAMWSAIAPGPTVVAAEYFVTNGDVLLTFSDELMVDSALLNPDVYSIFGPTSVEVTGVRTASATQVVLLTTGFGTGSYTVNVDQP